MSHADDADLRDARDHAGQRAGHRDRLAAGGAVRSRPPGAAELGVRRQGVDVVFSSDLRRAVQTVELAGLKAPHFVDWRLRECDYGELNGAPRPELEPRRARVDTPFPGGQSYREVVESTRSFLGDIRRLYDGSTVLVVAHSANRWALQHLLAEESLEDVVAAPFD